MLQAYIDQINNRKCDFPKVERSFDGFAKTPYQRTFMKRQEIIALPTADSIIDLHITLRGPFNVWTQAAHDQFINRQANQPGHG